MNERTINIKQSDCTFYVDQDARKVVCVLRDTQNLFKNHILKKNWIRQIPVRVWRQFEMPSSFRGVATCAPEDPWDEEFGKLVAFNKLKYKINTGFFKRAQLYIDSLDTAIDAIVRECSALGENLTAGCQKRDELIKARYKDENDSRRTN